MRLNSYLLAAALFSGTAILASSSPLYSQETSPNTDGTDPAPAEVIPDAPSPQAELALARGPQPAQQSQPPGPSSAPNENSSGSQQPSSSSQNPPQQPTSQETQKQKAAEQIKEEEQQRVVGVVPTFNVTYHSDAASMSAGQKLELAFRSSVDPFTFAAGFMVAGYHEALDDDTGFGWGPEGYFKRSGAAYLDAFNGTMIGNGFLPILFRQDPRYFRLGHGSAMHRLLYAVSTSYICKHDNTGKWEPNYSNVAGNIIAGAISNLYYPSQNSGWGQTISNGFIVTTEGTIGGVFNEFWPDISRKFLHKDPTHGLDAQLRAQDEQKKLDKMQAKQQKNQGQPAQQSQN